MAKVWTFEESPYAGSPVQVEGTIAQLQVLAFDHMVNARVEPDGTLVFGFDPYTGDPGVTVAKGNGGTEGLGWYVDGEYLPSGRVAYKRAAEIIASFSNKGIVERNK